MAQLDALVKTIEEGPDAPQLSLDMSRLVALDTTGLDGLEQVLNAVKARGGKMILCELNPQPRSLIERSGFDHKL